MIRESSLNQVLAWCVCFREVFSDQPKLSKSYLRVSVNINLLYFNVGSLLPKIDNLRSICTLYSPDIVCIVETWLGDTILDSAIAIQGYHLCRLDMEMVF